MRRSVWLTVEAMSSVVFATNLLLAQQGWLVTDQVSLYRAIHDHFDGARQIMAVGAQVHAYHVGLLLSPLALLGALALRRARSRTGSLVLFIGVGGAILVSEGLKLLVALPSP